MCLIDFLSAALLEFYTNGNPMLGGFFVCAFSLMLLLFFCLSLCMHELSYYSCVCFLARERLLEARRRLSILVWCVIGYLSWFNVWQGQWVHYLGFLFIVSLLPINLKVYVLVAEYYEQWDCWSFGLFYSSYWTSFCYFFLVLIHKCQCFICRLGDVLASLTSKKDNIPYENSVLTKVLADSLGIHAFVF